MTSGGDGFGAPAWSADGKTLYVVGNDGPRPEMDPIESEIYAVDVATGRAAPLPIAMGRTGRR